MPLPNANVKKLQDALKKYSQITGYTAADPGVVDGIVGVRTITAVSAMIPLLPGIPSELKILATLAPVVLVNADARNKAAEIITKNAANIANAIIGLAVYQAAQGNLPKPPTAGTATTQIQPQATTLPFPTQPIIQPWYETGWGIGLIVGGGLLTALLGALTVKKLVS